MKVRSKKKKVIGSKILKKFDFSGYFFKMLIKFTNLFYYYVNFINILKKWPEKI